VVFSLITNMPVHHRRIGLGVAIALVSACLTLLATSSASLAFSLAEPAISPASVKPFAAYTVCSETFAEHNRCYGPSGNLHFEEGVLESGTGSICVGATLSAVKACGGTNPHILWGSHTGSPWIEDVGPGSVTAYLYVETN